MKAVTYDFWNTLMWEEPGTMRALRRLQVEQALEAAGLQIEADRVEEGLLAISGLQRDGWMRGEVFQPHDGAAHFVGTLGTGLSEEHHEALATAVLLETANPDLKVAPGAEETLRILKEKGIRTAIVCDVGLAPSTVLRGCLESAGLLEYFDGWAFSDEVGHYKPAPEMFAHALESIEASPADAIHVGDLRRTDVAGSRSFGMMPVRFNGVLEDDDLESAEADHVIGDHREILTLLGLPG